MSDLFGGIKQIGPAYPVRPVRPSQKEREPGKRQRKPEEPPPEDRDDDDKPLIDEHV